MQPLPTLVTQLERDDDSEEALSIAAAIASELKTHQPQFLAEVAADWVFPYLTLELTHEDGTVFEMLHGDGYTRLRGGGVKYDGHIHSPSLVELLTAVARGGATYVHRSRCGYRVADFFELDGDDQRVGYGNRGIAGFPPLVLRSIPLLRESTRRTRLSFNHTPMARAV